MCHAQPNKWTMHVTLSDFNTLFCKKLWTLIRWLLMKPADQDPHFFIYTISHITVNSKFFVKILFFLIAFKDIFVTLEIRA